MRYIYIKKSRRLKRIIYSNVIHTWVSEVYDEIQ